MKTVIKLALIALLWISVINTGKLGSIDTELRLKMAHAWWTGTEEVDANYQPKSRLDLKAGVKGVGDRRYIAYDVGQSMLMLPADWLATKLPQWFPVIPSKYPSGTLRHLAVNFLIFVPLNVAAVVSCFWLLRVFEFEKWIAGLTSITLLLGTTFLHYSQVNFQNNQVLLFVTIGYAAALACVRQKRLGLAAISGLALGGACLIRMDSAFHVLTVFLFLLGCVAYENRDKFKLLQIGGIWLIGFVPLMLVARVCDYIRYGSFLINGQSLAVKQLATDPIWSGLPELPQNYPFINSPFVGIWGVLFSPAKSIFIYDPLLLPCLVLGIVLWRRFSPYVQWYLITAMFNLCLYIALTSRLEPWHGDWGWAARYHVTSIHLLLIPLIALFIQFLQSARGLKAWLMRLIIAVAIMVQIASVTIPMGVEIQQAQIGEPGAYRPGAHSEFRLGDRITNIACLIDHSFSADCTKRLNANQAGYFLAENQVFFLPFLLSKQATGKPLLVKLSLIVFAFWGLVLTLAIATTVWFIILGRKQYRQVC